jgi:uncharacterized membrane protein YdjX (TVP38/TMEM64 family)
MTSRNRLILKIVVVILALALLILLGRRAGGYLHEFAAWLDELGPWGPAVFITLAAGALFGLARGTLYVFVGATLGASAALLVARSIARSAIEWRLEAEPATEQPT